jgi:hypothetical protein
MIIQRNFKKNLAISICIMIFMSVMQGVFTPIVLGLNNPNSEFVNYNSNTNTWKIYPTGVNDQPNIEHAFYEAQNTSGATIELSEGIFLLACPVVIYDFDGSFRGAGRDKTIVQSLDNFELGYIPMWGYINDIADLFVFVYTNQGTIEDDSVTLTISDMSMLLVGDTNEIWYVHGQPTKQFGSFISVFSNRTDIKMNPNLYSKVNLNVYRLALNSTLRDGSDGYNAHGPYNAVWGILVQGGFQSSSIRIQDNHFNNIDTGGLVILDLFSSSLSLEENTFTNIDWIGARLFDFSGNHIEVTKNVFGSDGIQIYNSYTLFPRSEDFLSLVRPSTYHIHHNLIKQQENSWWSGVEMYDYSKILFSISTINPVIEKNEFHAESQDIVYGPIYGVFVDNALVRNNKFYGTSDFGIYVNGYPGFEANNWIILGNNLQHFDSHLADIYLGYDTSDCIVFLGASDSIIDEGMNNIIIG